VLFRSLNSHTKAWGRSVAPPCRLTPDGTVVTYWCDLPRKSDTGSHGMSFAVPYLSHIAHCSLPLHGFSLALCCMFSSYATLTIFSVVLNWWNHGGYLQFMWCHRHVTFFLCFSYPCFLFWRSGVQISVQKLVILNEVFLISLAVTRNVRVLP
jgi:hypothetical protein